MRFILLPCLLMVSINSYCQRQDSLALLQGRIRSICEYVSKNVLHAKEKPILWASYGDIHYPVDRSLRKAIPDMPNSVQMDTSLPQEIPFKDTTVVRISEYPNQLLPGWTLFLSPPQSHFFLCGLTSGPYGMSRGYILAFEFDGDRIVRSYVRKWHI